MTHRPASCPAASSSVPRSRARWRWIRRYFSPTSRREISTARTREMLHELLTEVVNDLEIGMVVVTHNRSLAARASRVLLLEGGKLSRYRSR